MLMAQLKETALDTRPESGFRLHPSQSHPRGVVLILHAGDLRELWVLDRLSAIAPTVLEPGLELDLKQYAAAFLEELRQ